MQVLVLRGAARGDGGRAGRDAALATCGPSARPGGRGGPACSTPGSWGHPGSHRATPVLPQPRGPARPGTSVPPCPSRAVPSLPCVHRWKGTWTCCWAPGDAAGPWGSPGQARVGRGSSAGLGERLERSCSVRPPSRPAPPRWRSERGKKKKKSREQCLRDSPAAKTSLKKIPLEQQIRCL